MQVKIQMLYSTPKNVVTTFVSEPLPAGEAIVMVEDMQKTGRISNILFVDNKEQEWNLKELKKLLEGIEEEPHDITIYFDGGYDIESGRAGLGCAIYYKQNGKSYRIRKNALVDELSSNNEAEYAALHLALKELEYMGARHIEVNIIGDSKVVIHQLNGEWPVYEETLSEWADRIDAKLEQLGFEPHYEAISRKGNREADQLAGQALRGEEMFSTLELEQK
ncbi:reverse transcriptase-like protein [Aciduricibacillus chroicocephali]|uniref:Reverse transcriptase-like protein n=1 Tax=Aciduricibacillus chroicocephali TaxID=3054939 RepID=A0ABY9KXK4_9BACI|nr:reverse transcriptase-like protein [Bacillaceae bacterium 44XB]